LGSKTFLPSQFVLDKETSAIKAFFRNIIGLCNNVILKRVDKNRFKARKQSENNKLFWGVARFCWHLSRKLISFLITQFDYPDSVCG
jgi:hypothetical protein